MQIRIQGNRIQCIRSEYDPAIKRSRQSVVTSFNRWLIEPPAESLELLTDDEKKELADFMEPIASRMEAASIKTSLRFCSSSIREAAAAVLADVENKTAEHAPEIWAAIAELEAALREKGFKKPRAVKKSS